MDLSLMSSHIRAAEAVTVETGSYTGLTLGEVLKDCPDIAYNGTLLRGRGQSAAVARSYLKLLKATDELVTALKAGDASAGKVVPRPRNSKSSHAMPLAETMALVPVGSKAQAKTVHLNSTAQAAPQLKDSLNKWRWPAWSEIRRICLWFCGVVITLGLPKLLVQVAGLLLRLVVKKSFIALEAAAGQAVLEVADAGSLFVSALEEALDIPSTSFPGSQGTQQEEQARLAGVAASTVIGASIGGNNTSWVAPAVQAAVAQTLSGQSNSQFPARMFHIPGWILVCLGGGLTRWLS